MPNPGTVSLSDDGTLWVIWGRVLLSLDEDGFSYAIREGDHYRAGAHLDWPSAVEEIKANISDHVEQV